MQATFGIQGAGHVGTFSDKSPMQTKQANISPIFQVGGVAGARAKRSPGKLCVVSMAIHDIYIHDTAATVVAAVK